MTIWMQTSSRRAFDLLAPRAADVDFQNDVAPALAGTNRFCGHAFQRSKFGSLRHYTVAQHCALGAIYLASIGDDEAAAAFLLHDAHEAYIGDIATPAADAIDTPIDDDGHIRLAKVGHARAALSALKARIDAAVFAAAGLRFPRPATVKEIDLRMLRTERDQLLGVAPRPWHAAIETAKPLPITIEIWPPSVAETYWLECFGYLLPQVGSAPVVTSEALT